MKGFIAKENTVVMSRYKYLDEKEGKREGGGYDTNEGRQLLCRLKDDCASNLAAGCLLNLDSPHINGDDGQ
jgi:hypothetical protein